MFTTRTIARLAALALIPGVAAAQNNQYGYPPKLAPRPTAAAISAQDLMTRLYIFADDSMQGRNAPQVGNAKGTAYIVRELTRLNIRPAGELGGYYQRLPYVQRSVSPRSKLSVNRAPLTMGTDFLITSRGPTKIIDSTRVIYAGVLSDPANMIPPDSANGRFVIVMSPPVTPGAPADPAAGRGGAPGGGRGAPGGGGRGGRGGGTENIATRYAGAIGIATIVPELGGAPAGGGGRGGGGGAGGGRGGAGGAGAAPAAGTSGCSVQPPAAAGGGGGRGGAGGATQMLNDPALPRVAGQYQITEAAAQKLLGRPVREVNPGALGGAVHGVVVYDDVQIPYASNVLAVIPGSDSVLKNEVIVISAHNDHVGIGARGLDHDSLRAARLISTRMQIRDGELVPLPQGTQIVVNVDSLRRIRPVRCDSISNGADDDGSGSMGVLEIAEAINAMPVKPKRTIVFAWWTAEEDGLIGSRWWTDHPTAALNNVVANINMDMIGRGRAEDVPGGGPDYLGYLGANRLATILEERVQAVNKTQQPPLKLDNRFDWPITWAGYNNIYGRSDHANFSRYNIPIVFFFTGLHADYHQITDEPQYIDYPHYSRIVNFVRDLSVDIGNLPTRPVVDMSGAVPPRPPR